MALSTDLSADFASLRIDRAPPLPLASLGARLLGHLVDLALFYGSLIGITWLLAPYRDSASSSWWVYLTVPVLNFGLCAWRGQTPGKMLAGTRVVTMHDARVPWWRLLLRYPAWALGLLDVVFVFDATRRPLHDKLAGTRVVTAAASGHLYG